MIGLARPLARRRTRWIGYALLALLLALLALFPAPQIARAKLLPQDPSSAGVNAILNSLGGQLQSFAALLANGRPPNDLYLILGRSDPVATQVAQELKLDRRYGSLPAAKRALAKRADVHLLLGGVVEVETNTYDPAESQQLADAYLRAISRQIGRLGRENLRRRQQIVRERFGEAGERVSRAETALQGFRRANRLADPEAQLGAELSLRTTLQAQLRAKQVELAGIEQYAGAENQQRRVILEEIASLQRQIAQTTRAGRDAAGPNLAGLTEVQSRYLNLYRDYRFAQALYEVYARASEQVAVESLVAETATWVQVIEPAHLDPERHYNIWALAALAGIVLLALFTEWYGPATGLWRWPERGNDAI